MMKALDHL